MPELPEVEVIRLFLYPRLVGKKITRLNILTPKSFIGSPTQIFNSTITRLSRKGKQLSIHFANKLTLLFHLKMTGQLIVGDYMLGHPTKTINPKSTRLIFTFSDQSTLYFNDQRKFGWVKLLTNDELSESQKNLGVDILSPDFTCHYLYSQLHRSSRPIKTYLLDQSRFAGVGNIYANDAIFLSRIHPLTPSNKITLALSKKLTKNLIEIMKLSIQSGGSTAKDNNYVRPDGSRGSNQFYFRVYQKQGQPCLVCGTPIERLKINGRSAFFCPRCQPLQSSL